MENETSRPDSDMGLSQTLGFQDFDYQENHIWCEQCKQLKQELKKLKEEQALNYSTLKKKIISTDLLIKKYKGKCDDYDAQSKKYEEFFRKHEDLQRESETLNTQLVSALQQLEPLRKAKAVLEVDNKQKEDAAEAMRNRIAGLELSIKQFEEVSKTSETYKDRYDMLKREHQRKRQNLQAVNQKNEVIINKLRDENKALKQEHAVNSRKQKRLEEKLRKVVVRLDTYWDLLKRNGLLPRGEKKPIVEKFLDISGDFSVSQDEEDTCTGHVSEMESEDDSSPESDTFPWIFSPVVSALSPLPPSPMPCRANKKLMSNIESDDVDEMADMLQSELLKSSPVRTPSNSLLKKVQTRSKLIESKQKHKNSIQRIKKNNEEEKSKKSTHDSITGSGKAQLLKSKSFTTINADSENLSDSDNEDTKDKNVSEYIGNNSICGTSTDNKVQSGNEDISEKDEKMISINEENRRSQGKDNTIDHSEHSMFQKVKPQKVSKEGSSSDTLVGTDHAVVVKEAFPPPDVSLENNDGTSQKNGGKVDTDKPSNIARKIEFIENPETKNSSKDSVAKICDTQTVKTLPSLSMTGDSDMQHSQKFDSLKERKEEIHNMLTTCNIQVVSEVEQTTGSIGFDLDDLAYSGNEGKKTTLSESCVTPSLDIIISLTEGKDRYFQDHELKIKAQKVNCQQEKSDINYNKYEKQYIYKNKEIDLSNESEKASENVSVEKPSLMSRQVSSGFVLKSPPINDNDTVEQIFYPLGPKPRIAHNPGLSKAKTVLYETTKDCLVSESSSDAAEHPERRISQQGSLGFSIDDDCVSPCNENEDTSKQTSTKRELTKTKDKSLYVIEESISATSKSENNLLKEKYLAYIKSKTSSHVFGEERQDKGDNCKSSKFSEPLKCYKSHSSKAASDNGFLSKESDPVKKCEKKKDKRKGVYVKTAENSTKTTHNENLLNVSKNPATTQHSSETNKKTLHQLVVNALDSKTIPSSTVISPDVPSISKVEDQRPLSHTSISSAQPLSPLTVSPFDYSLPMLISPLPPSPSHWREPVSPLPGSPLVEDDIAETQSESSTPAVLEKKSGKKKSKNKPCSFSSNVPIHAIQVKPISACTNQPSAKIDEVVLRTTVPESGERDPLAMGKKQRISRVPKQTTASKRKSLEPMASEIQDKKKCVIDEKGAAPVLERPEVKQETGYWKDVDMYLQQYICVYTMTLDDIRDKLSIEKDPAAILPAVVLWVTQFLRNSEAEMVNNMYKFCNDDDNSKSGPFMTTQESRLADLCSYIIQKKFLIEFKTKLLDALWNAIMLKEVVTTFGRTALCRVFTAVCQKEGNVDFVRVLFYHIIASGYPKFITLGLSIVGVWPQVLYKSETVRSDLLDTLEFCIMKILLNDQGKYDKVITCYTKLCNWKKPNLMESKDRLRTLLRELQTVTRKDETESVVSEKQFELNRSLELLLCTEDQTFLKSTFIQLCLNQLFQKVKSKNIINGGFPVMYFKIVLSVYASQLSRRVDTKSALKNIRKFVAGILRLQMVSMEVQEVIVNILLDIAYIAPMPIFAQLTEWYQREQKSVANVIKQRLEKTRIMLIPYEGKLTTLSFN